MTTVQRDEQERQGYKPREVDEPIDRYLHRPLAALLVRLLLPLPITPNQVTLISAFFGLLAGATITVGVWRGPRWVAAGGLVLLASIVFDCADGQLARLRGQSSAVGRILDGVMDVAGPLSVFHGFAFFLLSCGHAFGYVWPIGLAAACSLVLHTSQYDGVKNLYLHCSRPDFSLGGKTLLTVADVLEFKRQFRADRRWFHVFLMWVWERWIGSQSKTFEAWQGELSPRDAAERELYVAVYRAHMRAWSWLGFGLHLFLLVGAALATPLYADAVWVAWLVMLGPLNLLHGYLVWRRPRLKRAFAARLSALRGGAGAGGAAEPSGSS